MINNGDQLRDSYLSLACEYEKLAEDFGGPPGVRRAGCRFRGGRGGAVGATRPIAGNTRRSNQAVNTSSSRGQPRTNTSLRLERRASAPFQSSRVTGSAAGCVGLGATAGVT